MNLGEFQNPETGPKKRTQAEKKVRDLITGLVNSWGYKKHITEHEVLLDIPLRPMDLGGEIFIRGYDGNIEPAECKSTLLKELKNRFDAMSKIVRVFVSPQIRDGIRPNYKHENQKYARGTKKCHKKKKKR